jgi:Resolvase, N terminal domain
LRTSKRYGSRVRSIVLALLFGLVAIAAVAADWGNMAITRFDRLVRSTRGLLNIVHDFKQAGATFRSLEEPWADTSSELAELMLTILGAAAKLERATILVRTGEQGTLEAARQAPWP